MKNKRIVLVLTIAIVLISLAVIGFGISALITREYNSWGNILLGFALLLLSILFIIRNTEK